MKKYFTGTILIGILSILFIGGCSSKKSMKEATQKVTLNVACWGKPVEISRWKKYVKTFEQKHPGIQIKLLFSQVGSSYDSKLMVMIVGGCAPDIMMLSDARIPVYAEKNIILDLNSLAEEDDEFSWDDFYPVSLELLSYKGKVYALPSGFCTFVMYYNKDIFDEAGIPYPDETWTWDTLLEKAKLLTRDRDGDGRIDQYGFITDLWTLPIWVWQNGGRILNEEATECLLDQPEAYEAIQFLADLMHKYKVSPTPIHRRDTGVHELFMRGRVAMYGPVGGWITEFALQYKPKFRWDVAPPPMGKKRATLVGATGPAIYRGTKHVKEAWEFVKYLVSPEIQRSEIPIGGLPALRALTESEEFLTPDIPPAHDEVFREVIAYARGWARTPKFDEITSKLDFSLVFLGKESAKEACLRAKKDIDVVLQRKVDF